MDFINTALVTLKQPTGMWESILSAFRNGTGSYILAVILIAVLVRLLFSVVDIINKKVNMKNSNINAKMKPELDAIQKKYGHDQRLLQQKQNEVYKKYQFSMMSSCLPMLISLVLQFTVFLTLWNSLQAVANYNIVEKYENVKDIYANVVNLNTQTTVFENGFYTDGDSLSVEVDLKNNKMTLKNTTTGEIREDLTFDPNLENDDIYNDLLNKYIIKGTDEELNINYVETGYNEVLRSLAEVTAKDYYEESQESFLWITNIYRPENSSSPLFTKDEIKTNIKKYYTDEQKTLEEENDFEGKIFGTIIEDNDQFDAIRKQNNGYYILTIIAVLSSFLSMWLSNFLMKNKNQPAANGQKQSKLMYFIMPIIFGIFTFMYTSLFAVYIIVGQLVMIALTPLTTWIVKKWVAHDTKKQKEKDVIEVDYRRKDI